MDISKMTFRFEKAIEGGNFIEKIQAKKIIMKLYNAYCFAMNNGITRKFNDLWAAKKGEDSFGSEEYEESYSEMAMHVARKISEAGIGKLITGKHVYLDNGLDCVLLDSKKRVGTIYGKIE